MNSIFKLLLAFLFVSHVWGSQKQRIQELFIEMQEGVDVHPQLIRMAFHDAAHFDQDDGLYMMGCVSELLSEGCPAHDNMDAAITFRDAILNQLTAEGFTATKADLTQLLGALAVDRLSEGTDFTQSLFDQMRLGRSDIEDCDDVCEHLPDFSVGGANFHERFASVWTVSFQSKMVETMGFTEIEAVALLGAHTVGRVRDQFPGSQNNGPWTMNPFTFDNAYFKELQNIVQSQTDCPTSPVDDVDCLAPFHRSFPTWFQDNINRFVNWFDQMDFANGVIAQLPEATSGLKPLMTDADMAIAFKKPEFVNLFADDMILWRTEFNIAYKKMSELGCTSDNDIEMLDDKDVDENPQPLDIIIPCPVAMCNSIGICPAGTSVGIPTCTEQCCMSCPCCMAPGSNTCVPSCPDVFMMSVCPNSHKVDDSGCEIDECAPLEFEYVSLGDDGFCRDANGVMKFMNDADFDTEAECKAMCDTLHACAGYQYGRTGKPKDCNFYFAAEGISSHKSTFEGCQQKQGKLSLAGYSWRGAGFCRDANGQKFHLASSNEVGEFECKLKCDQNPLCDGFTFGTNLSTTKCNLYSEAAANSGSGGLGGCWGRV